MIRFGILPFTLVLLLQIVGSQAPLTSDLSAWYASKGLIVVALVLALAVWSFRHALGGRKVLQGYFLKHGWIGLRGSCCHVNLAEPDPKLFELPEGFDVVDSPQAGRAAPGVSQAKSSPRASLQRQVALPLPRCQLALVQSGFFTSSFKAACRV